MNHTRKSDTLLRLLAISFTALIALQILVAPASAGVPSKINIKIGIVLPITGGLGTIGVDEIRAANLAVSQANHVLGAGTTGVNFTTLPTCNSATDPIQADNCFKNVVDVQGAQVVVGAAGSREVNGFKASADIRNVPAISPSSTAASLAIADDYIFRAPGNDLVQAPAVAAWLCYNGIEYLAMITRQDPYGTGLRDGVRNAFLDPLSCGVEVADVTATTYDPDSIPAAQTATTTANTQVGTLITNAGGNNTKVGVLIIAFEDDGHAIFDQARTETNLPNVRWWGTDGIGGSNAFIPPGQCGPGCGTGSPAVADFMANTVNVTGTFATSPVLASGGASMYTLALNGAAVTKRVGSADAGTIDCYGTPSVCLTDSGWNDIYSSPPQPYWDYAYDSAVLAMLAILKANSYVGADIASQLIPVGGLSIGSTGLLSLGAQGDRAVQHYILYGYNHDGTNATCCFSWDFSGVHGYYNADTGMITGSQPTASEAGGAVWTTLLQDLAEAVTVTAVYSFANAYVALSLLFLAVTAALTITRRRRI